MGKCRWQRSMGILLIYMAIQVFTFSSAFLWARQPECVLLLSSGTKNIMPTGQGEALCDLWIIWEKNLTYFEKYAKMLHGENNFTTWIIKVKNIFKTIVTSIYNPKYLVVRLVHHPLIFWNEKFKLARLHKLINKCWNNIKNSACSLFEKWRFICVNISWQI